MTKKQVADRKIKVHVNHEDAPGEYLWARRISKNTAKIENIPFLSLDIGCGDLVRISPSGEVLKVLEHVAESWLLRYAEPVAQSEEELQERYVTVREELNKHDIFTEGMVSGVCSISVPLDVSDEQLARIAREIGAEVIGLDSEEE